MLLPVAESSSPPPAGWSHRRRALTGFLGSLRRWHADGAGGGAGGGGEKAPDPAQLIAALEERLEKRFADVLGRVDGFKGFVNDELKRLRRSGKAASESGEGEASSGQGGAPAGGEGSAASSRADALAMRKLGRLEAQLPQALQERVDKMLESGASLAEIASFAEALHLGYAANARPDGAPAGGANPQQTPVGAAGSAAPKTSKAYPQTLAEYLQIARKANSGDKDAKARKAELDRDPAFAADELK